MLAVCLLGLNQACFAEDYGFDYPLLFDWTVRPTGEGNDSSPLTTWPYGFHAVHDEITPINFAGSWRNAYDWRHRGSMTECYNQNRPVVLMLTSYTGPVNGTTDPDALTKVMDYLSYKGMRLDYVFSDFGSSTTQTNVAEAIQQIGAHSDPNINQARVGNFAYFASAENWSRPDPPEVDWSYQDGFYRSSGMNVSMPCTYQFEEYAAHADAGLWGTNISPNNRSALFWAPMESFGTAARNLPAGHQLIPFHGNFIPLREGDLEYPADPLPHEDIGRLLQHFRLRGADGYYQFPSYQDDWFDDPIPSDPLDIYGNENFKTAMLDAWHELDWLFDDIDKEDVEVLNTATDKIGGFEWSAVQTANGVALLSSNLNTSAHDITAAEMLAAGMDSPFVVELFGSTSGQMSIAAGTHSLDTYSVAVASVPEPSSLLLLAGIFIVLAGRASVKHKLFHHDCTH